jgi:hypothetical protein
MISETLSELNFEFIAILEEVHLSDDSTYRNALIAHARHVFREAVGTWQEELTVLNTMLQSLINADTHQMKSAVTSTVPRADAP